MHVTAALTVPVTLTLRCGNGNSNGTGDANGDGNGEGNGADVATCATWQNGMMCDIYIWWTHLQLTD